MSLAGQKTLEGGCACGAVRYALCSTPYDAGWCHCSICRRISGAPAIAYATVPFDDWKIVTGEAMIGSFRSSSFGVRQFCRDCGSPLTMQVAHQPDTIDFTLGSLDDPEAVAPGFHIFTAETPHWGRIEDGLPRHQGFRPNTRGLQA